MRIKERCGAGRREREREGGRAVCAPSSSMRSSDFTLALISTGNFLAIQAQIIIIIIIISMKIPQLNQLNFKNHVPNSLVLKCVD